MLGINAAGFNIGTHFVSWDFTMAAIVTVLAVLVLGFIFRYTAIGLQMRAVVESPRMVELAGVELGAGERGGVDALEHHGGHRRRDPRHAGPDAERRTSSRCCSSSASPRRRAAASRASP